MSKLSPALALVLFGLLAVLVALIAWPQRGLAFRFYRRFGRSDGVVGEDLLKALFHGRAADKESAARVIEVPPARLDRIVAQLRSGGELEQGAGELTLSDAGRARALHLVRAHRLWERYLADRTGLAEAEWHEAAERQEHMLSPEEADRLAARIGRPLLDPHGDPIPEAVGGLRQLDGVALSKVAVGRRLEVVHLEDEPEDAYRRLVELGLAPGEVIELIRKDGDQLEILLDGRGVTMSAADAEQVTVKASRDRAVHHRSLAELESGRTGLVLGLAPTLRGPQRRRLLDLGFVPGTEVTAELRSAMGEPMAFRVRGALIALRREQAAAVWVEAA